MSSLAPRAPIRRTLRTLRPVAWLLLVLAIFAGATAVIVSIETNLLWFHAVGDSSVYHQRLITEVEMFAVFGGPTALLLAITTIVAARLKPTPAAETTPSRIRSQWLAIPRSMRGLLLTAIPIGFGLKAGFAASSRWIVADLWRHPITWHRTDPHFHRDVSYFVFIYPMHRLVVSAVIYALVVAIVSVLVIAWLRGAIQLRGASPRFTYGLRALASLLLGLLAVAKAGAYWLDRLATVTSSRGRVTGQSYVDLHIVLPMKIVLLILSLALALLFLGNVAFAKIAPIVVGLTVMIGGGLIIGGAVPAIVNAFVAKPAAVIKEKVSIERNIAATRYAFDVSGVNPTAAASGNTAASLQPQLLDPNVVARNFTQSEAIQNYYSFKSTLDVDRYDIKGKPTVEDVGVRELNLSKLSSSQQGWTNTHLTYVNGKGVVAAPVASVDSSGQPAYNESDGSGVLGAGGNQNIYFGQQSPKYSIVPNTDTTTGVPISGDWHRLLYALKFTDKNVLFSSDIKADDDLLYRRNPAARISAVAPWLTLDGDIYPVVAGGQITWVADGYTTTNMLPDSQLIGLRSATMTTYVKNGSTAKQSAAAINYIRNSVVATVDATTGRVTLYNKPGATPDPILESWEQTFPGLVKPADELPANLIPHLRYPEDLFNIQRTVLAKYHVEDEPTFYAGSAAWNVPGDPTVAANVSQPSYYAETGSGSREQFTLTSPLLSTNRKNMAAYLSVDCDYGTPDYGQLQLTPITNPESTDSPQQLQAEFKSNRTIAHEITFLSGGGSTVKTGNLQTVLVGGQVLAIEPIFEQTKSKNSIPALQDVIVKYGANSPVLAHSFAAALVEALGINANSASASTLLAQAQSLYDEYQADVNAGDKKSAASDLRKLGRLLQSGTTP